MDVRLTMMSGIPIPWKKIITMTISTDAAQYMKEYVTPSKTNPMAHINPLDSRPFNFETMSDPTNAPAAIQPSVNAKSDAVPCNAIFTKIGRPTMAGPIMNRLLMNVIMIIQKMGFCP